MNDFAIFCWHMLTLAVPLPAAVAAFGPKMRLRLDETKVDRSHPAMSQCLSTAIGEESSLPPSRRTCCVASRRLFTPLDQARPISTNSPALRYAHLVRLVPGTVSATCCSADASGPPAQSPEMEGVSGKTGAGSQIPRGSQ